MRKIIFCCCLIWILSVSPLPAVDGYKSLKFGMSLEEVKKSKFCSFIDDKSISHIRIIYCFDFRFNGNPIMAAAYFIDNKFLRLALDIPYLYKKDVLAALIKKYKYSLDPGAEAVSNFNSSPNQEIWYGFDNNTVYLLCKSDKFYKKSMLMIYTSLLYEKLRSKKQANSLKDDL